MKFPFLLINNNNNPEIMKIVERQLRHGVNKVDTKLEINKIKKPNKKLRYCYWSVADGKHCDMIKTTVESARRCGVKEDFHIWTDKKEIDGAIVHSCGNFDKKLYMFKFHFLKNEVSKLDYDYFVFLDADNYFVRNPRNLMRLMKEPNSKVFVQMANDCNPETNKRGNWWGCPIKQWKPFLHSMGVKTDKCWNTNAGFWIVAKDAIDEVYSLAVRFFEEAHKRKYKAFTEEPSLAYIGHMLQNPYDREFHKTNWLWASDWNGQWEDKLPEDKEWIFEDYMQGIKIKVNPCIVHAMRSKEALMKNNNSVIAAHFMYVKTGNRQKVWFQERRKNILKYFMDQQQIIWV